ncbi:hypothetical protein GBA65_12245 [Rubrobacter marinus]|uniref:Probable multidrug resistance protein NorM n=1 Tax=Rubrobacter marinus TaxID=2653852 RepID=A0A6G8PY45_9ACTN|nr:MATE family efflux transporter [Rubrobacter marinus]QIN79164.1 hypothetical protein GBA65_12245 [Rubrobacter marinus]
MKRNPKARAQDREILRLALPALGALAAEPTYVLVDTAIVGHLGTPELGALAIAGILLTTSVTLFNFLTYGTTARVARLHGAGEDGAVGSVGSGALWISVALGGLLLALALLFAGPAVSLMGGDGRVGEMAVEYLRISALGLPFAMIALAGRASCAGGRPEAAAPNRGNGERRERRAGGAVRLRVRVGIAGSAWGTVIAQAGMGAAFVLALLRASGACVSRGGPPSGRS